MATNRFGTLSLNRSFKCMPDFTTAHSLNQSSPAFFFSFWLTANARSKHITMNSPSSWPTTKFSQNTTATGYSIQGHANTSVVYTSPIALAQRKEKLQIIKRITQP